LFAPSHWPRFVRGSFYLYIYAIFQFVPAIGKKFSKNAKEKAAPGFR